MKKTWSQVELIREAFHYQSRFAGTTMVFKVDFPVISDPLFPSLVKDLALLAQTGFRVVIVPGAKEWIDEVLSEYEIISRSVEWESLGLSGKTGDGVFGTEVRITPAEAMPFIEMAAFNTAALFMTGFSGSRLEAVIGNFIRARGLGVLNGTDMEHTGTVDKFFTDSVRRVLELGMVPIIPCIGWNPTGKSYNVSSDEIALAASANLGAAKLFIVSLEGALKKGAVKIPEGVETGEDGRVIRLTPHEAMNILEMNGDLPKDQIKPLKDIALALSASRAGVDRVHIINGAEEGAVLKELFSNLGAGTMLYAGDYEAIRPLHNRDIPDILRLMGPLMQQGFLLRRNQGSIQEKKEDYAVFEIDGQIRACAALHDWGENQGEIAALATDPLYENIGIGRRLVGYFLERAAKKGLSRVFVLTTRTHDWFESLGFKEAPVESLPEKKRRLYDKNRNSKVFALDIGKKDP